MLVQVTVEFCVAIEMEVEDHEKLTYEEETEAFDSAADSITPNFDGEIVDVVPIVGGK